ncbi:MAG: pyruvate kinase, partial [Deltaproteobacteria bacterium]
MNCDIVNKNQLRRTKIICTIGPSTNSPAQIEKLILSGMDVARLNFSHGNHKEHGNCINTIRKIGKKLRLPIAIMQDLPGPKNRIGKFAEGMIELKKDDIFTITDKKVLGDKSKVSVSVPHLSQRVNVGDDIFLNDGTMKLKVLDTTSTDIKCQVMVGGMLGSEKGINIPNVETDISALTDDDWKHLDFGVEQKVDFVALSFVSSADDIIKVREFIHSKNANIGIIAKIERNTALDNLDEIIDCADGIMVARGDLGLEIPIQRVPIVQKNIINKCNLLGKPVIVATQMLESMVNSPTPNRPEVTDIANAIFDGADALMLSEETAIGSYPIEAVSMMFKIIMETEAALPYDEILASKGKHIQ